MSRLELETEQGSTLAIEGPKSLAIPSERGLEVLGPELERGARTPSAERSLVRRSPREHGRWSLPRLLPPPTKRSIQYSPYQRPSSKKD